MAYVHENDDFYRLSPLSEDGIEPADREFDLLLTQMLRQIGESPAGLADRVFQASVSLLPQPVANVDDMTLRFVPAARERLLVRRRAWSRVALAASVALACIAGLKVCLPGTGAGGGGSQLAANTAGTMVAVTEADWGTFSGSETGNGAVTPLLRASAVSYNDLVSEMTMLVHGSDAEM